MVLRALVALLRGSDEEVVYSAFEEYLFASPSFFLESPFRLLSNELQGRTDYLFVASPQELPGVICIVGVGGVDCGVVLMPK